MSNDDSLFKNIILLEKPIRIAIAKDNQFVEAIGLGNIEAVSVVKNEEIKCEINNVFYIPNLRRNLLSVKRLVSADVKVIFENGILKLEHKNKIISVGKMNNLYEVKFKRVKYEAMNVEYELEESSLWHKRFGHIGQQYLKNLIQHNMVIGIESVKLNNTAFCESCVIGKMSRQCFGEKKE